ncbi:unnamed protein product [Symbiodinium sp. CCMP2592]|nr:unnamed protein product [Symbiodinium sp. CCMP2592]
MDDYRGRPIGAILEDPDEPGVSPPRPSVFSVHSAGSNALDAAVPGDAGPLSDPLDALDVDLVDIASSAGELSEASRDVSTLRDQRRDGMVAIMTNMRATRPEIIRAVPARHALWICGQAFRAKLDHACHLHKYSRATRHIDEFWSHSWHWKPWMKSTTALFVSNGFAAAVLGLFGAVLAAVLLQRQVLPVDHRGWQRWFAGSHWTVLFGTLTYYLALIFWPSQRRVFLDIICIDQEKPSARGEALLSIGAILKSSSRMLILWDRTWMARLWCVFELAGWLHSRKQGTDAKRNVGARPVLLGPLLVTSNLSLVVILLGAELISTYGPSLRGLAAYLIPLSVVLPLFLILSHVGRAFCRSIDDLQQALATFSTGQTKCGCCDAGHLDANGEPMACDREILLRCIELWYGDLSSFEVHVKGNVRAALLEQLTSPLFLYWHVVGAASPVMWFFLGNPWWPLLTLTGSTEHVLSILNLLVGGLTMWLAAIPALVLLSLMLAYLLRRQRSYFAFDILCSMMVVLAGGFVALASIAGGFVFQTMGLGALAVNFACNLCVALACGFLFSKSRRCALAI